MGHFTPPSQKRRHRGAAANKTNVPLLGRNREHNREQCPLRSFLKGNPVWKLDKNSEFNFVSSLFLRVRLLERRCFQELIASNANLLRVPGSQSLAPAMRWPQLSSGHYVTAPIDNGIADACECACVNVITPS